MERDLRAHRLGRTTRSVMVTAEGAVYYDRVVRLLADLADIEPTAKQSLAKPSGRLRSTYPSRLLQTCSLPRWATFTGTIRRLKWSSAPAIATRTL